FAASMRVLVVSLSLFLFFSLISLPPRPTLFPYTTLFRSGPCPLSPRGSSRPSARRAAAPWGGARGPVPAPPASGARTGASPPAADRKSTRLNSSHQIISYAVFCLKKKKKKQEYAHTTHTH